VTRFIGNFTTRLRTTSNYSAITNRHTLQITTAHSKSFSACCVFTSRFLVTASNSEVSSAFALTSLLSGEYPTTELTTKSQSHIATNGQSVLVSSPHLGLMTRYLLLFDSYSLVIVGRHLWREDGSVFCQKNSKLTLSLAYNISAWTTQKRPLSIVI
jgi:hypothetical protein